MKKEDLKIESLRDGIDCTGVRVTHKPTGWVVTCDDYRSEMRNKAQAIEILREKLGENDEDELVPITIYLSVSEIGKILKKGDRG